MKNRISIKTRKNLRKLKAEMVRRAQHLYDTKIDPCYLGEGNEY